MNDVYIVAGGTSLEKFDFSKLKGKEIIAVNKAILDAPFAKYFITMDFSFMDKKLKGDERDKFEVSKATKVFIANLYPKYMIEYDGRIIDRRNNYVYQLNDFDIIIKSHYKTGIGYEFNKFAHGNNSGFAALQLAICLGYINIHLLGFDLKTSFSKTHYHKGYNQNLKKLNIKLEEYGNNFISVLKILRFRRRDIKIYNYSPKSLINSLTIAKNLEDIK